MRRLQVILNDEAWASVEKLTRSANDNFDAGTISYSDAINEMVVCSKVDVKALQLKHSDLRRSLKSLSAKKELDIDAVIRALMELKTKNVKRKPSGTDEEA